MDEHTQVWKNVSLITYNARVTLHDNHAVSNHRIFFSESFLYSSLRMIKEPPKLRVNEVNLRWKWKTIICYTMIRYLGQTLLDTNGASGIIGLMIDKCFDILSSKMLIAISSFVYRYRYKYIYILIIYLNKHTSLSGPLLVIFTYWMLLALVYFSTFTKTYRCDSMHGTLSDILLWYTCLVYDRDLFCSSDSTMLQRVTKGAACTLHTVIFVASITRNAVIYDIHTFLLIPWYFSDLLSGIVETTMFCFYFRI